MTLKYNLHNNLEGGVISIGAKGSDWNFLFSAA